MPFEPGNPKPEKSGRKPGTPNRSTKKLEELLEEHGIQPIEELAAILPDLDPPKRADIMLRLADFLWPKRKAVEMQIEAAAPLEDARPKTRHDWQVTNFLLRQACHSKYETPVDSWIISEEEAYERMNEEPPPEKVAEWAKHHEDYRQRNRERLENVVKANQKR